MTDPRRHVRPGQPLALAAEQVNWINEQMRRLGGLGGAAIAFPQAPYDSLPCLNATTQTVDRWGVLQIAGVEAQPTNAETDATRQFLRVPVLRGVMPTGLSNSFAVAIEPIRGGEIGPCAVSGVVQVKCDITSTGDDYVRTQFNSRRLKTGGYGEGLILWKEPGTGSDKWALVRLGTPAGAVMIRFSGAWPLDASKSVTILDTSDTLNAVNRFVSISAACEERTGAAIKYGDSWYLIAAQFE